jgi:hypothetical protein
MAPLLPYAVGEDVAFRCAGFVAEGLTQLADPDRVMQLVEEIVHPDPIADTVRALIDDGIAAEAYGRRIDILWPVRHALMTAVKTLEAAQEGSPVGVRVSDGVCELVAAWVDPDLLVAEITDEYRQITRYPEARLLPSGQFTYRREDPNRSANHRWRYGALPDEVVDAFLQADIVMERGLSRVPPGAGKGRSRRRR